MQAIGVAFSEPSDQGFEHRDITSRRRCFCKGFGGVISERGIGVPNGVKPVKCRRCAMMFLHEHGAQKGRAAAGRGTRRLVGCSRCLQRAKDLKRSRSTTLPYKVESPLEARRFRNGRALRDPDDIKVEQKQHNKAGYSIHENGFLVGATAWAAPRYTRLFDRRRAHGEM